MQGVIQKSFLRRSLLKKGCHMYWQAEDDYTSLALFCDLLLELLASNPSWTLECILATRSALLSHGLCYQRCF